MMAGQCELSDNGCIALQETNKIAEKNIIRIESNCKSIDDLWKAINEIRGLLMKSMIGIGALTAAIQIIFKFWNV